jgi:hypothetical protein
MNIYLCPIIYLADFVEIRYERLLLFLVWQLTSLRKPRLHVAINCIFHVPQITRHIMFKFDVGHFH